MRKMKYDGRQEKKGGSGRRGERKKDEIVRRKRW